MDFMEHWERMTAKQELERDRLRVHQITVQVDDKKKSKHHVRKKNSVIEYGLVERDLHGTLLMMFGTK